MFCLFFRFGYNIFIEKVSNVRGIDNVKGRNRGIVFWIRFKIYCRYFVVVFVLVGVLICSVFGNRLILFVILFLVLKIFFFIEFLYLRGIFVG